MNTNTASIMDLDSRVRMTVRDFIIWNESRSHGDKMMDAYESYLLAIHNEMPDFDQVIRDCADLVFRTYWNASKAKENRV